MDKGWPFYALAVCTLSAVMACGGPPEIRLEPGVSRRLAAMRAQTISDVRYHLVFRVPARLEEPIRGRARIGLQLSDSETPLVLDFAKSAEHLESVRVEGEDVAYSLLNEHIVIPPGDLRVGENEIEIGFIAGDESLNRDPDFLYTLFVPDRARYAFPCFDQPNLKARFTLELRLNNRSWQAVSNTAGEVADSAGYRSWTFEETPPISTYLFSFAAGQFRVIDGERDGRRMRMYHRETDRSKVARNVGQIFDLHASALRWLEDYTGIGYPFEKFDFVLIPSFQYSGMEHPGAILYGAERLLLDRSATQDKYLARASLIAHETAHMWFGDLVTMEWFNDVWMKEVFANFMAAKIVNPAFPEVDHDLRFLLAHYPPAYDVDRTAGANPIRQRLDNLNEAGSLYGAIIYQKAPIVMRQLEALTGEDLLRSGLQEYLRRYRFANAAWPDLIAILDEGVDADLKDWSGVWVGEPGRPAISVSLSLGEQEHGQGQEHGQVQEEVREEVREVGEEDQVVAQEAGQERQAEKIRALRLEQSDPRGRGVTWNQHLGVVLGYSDSSQQLLPVQFTSRQQTLAAANGLPAPAYVLANGGGLGYGLFTLDSLSLNYLLESGPALPHSLDRGVVWLTFWDATLEGALAPDRFADLLARALATEPDEQLIERLLAYLRAVYWRFLSPSLREVRAPVLEALVWNRMEMASEPSLKASFFNAFRDIAVSPDAVDRLERVWRRQLRIEGLPLAESDYSTLALELAVREVDDWDRILRRQQARIKNNDRARHFAFVRPALSADPAERDTFFAGLADPANRAHEPWVLEAVAYLHHPLRAEHARKYILPSLDLLREIQATGDIFFPKRWLDATLDGHSSPDAAAIVRDFLDAHPDFPSKLRDKILQSGDMLFRAARLKAYPPEPMAQDSIAPDSMVEETSDSITPDTSTSR
jgi:aminopeptidase N